MKSLTMIAAVLSLSTGVWQGAKADVRQIDGMDLSGSYNGGGQPTGVRRSVCGTPLSVSGKTYERGIGMRAEGAVGFRLDGRATAFDALVGVDDCATTLKHGNRQARVIFKVWTDGKIVWTSPELGENARPVPVHVDLAGVRELYLEISSGAPWVAVDGCAGDWLDARITAADEASIRPIVDREAIRQLGILTPSEKAEPRINGADIWGVRPGHPVIFRVATSGERPMKFTAKGVPEGVTFDTAKGILGGVAPLRKGDYDIEVTAENAKGKATRTIRLAVGDTIALTPPMGWNSWNIWGGKFNGEHARAAARALDASGLGDHGWAYVNLDDFWEMNNSPKNKDRPELRGPARDAEGRILSNPSFPDMKKLTDDIHSFGFRAGLYSSPGPTTCGGCEGSYGHELQDAARWAEWGFDYVKYDWCSYDEVLKDELGGKPWYDGDWRDVRGASKERPYRLMKDCLLKQNRDIVYSFCQYGMGHAEEWARDAGANCWRCWEDLKDGWPWMLKALESRIGAENYWKFAGPGCWVDPDMLIVGDQRSFGYTHPTFLTPNEQYTHVSLWCMIGSPLLIGCDLTKLDPFTRSLLVNDEVIAVSQDRLGQIARRIRHTDAEDVWMRPLSGNFVALALVNRSPFAREIRVDFKELGLGGERWVKDLWRQKCEGLHYGFYSAVVPPHATKLVKSCPADCPKCDDRQGARPAETDGFRPCAVRGHTHPNAWVVSNTGRIVQADTNGCFEMTFPVQGVYCLKAMADGFEEAVCPNLVVPTQSDVDLPLADRPDPKRRVVHGDLGHPAQLQITDSGKPVRGFDIAGTPVGSYRAPKGAWHQKNRFFWTLGEYCFTATGAVKIVETRDPPELRSRGWYKGDFHAHIIHGESFYRANLQMMDFVCRAEGYDWIYLAGAHANDGCPVDYAKLAEYLSDDRLFLRVNSEFPKNIYGHFGNFSCPPLKPRDWGPGYGMDKVTNLELAERTIYANGGLAVPVHPIYGAVVKTDKKTGRKMYGMINNELMLWLLCCPERVPVVDFFYFAEDRAEDFWYRLLNRGYTLACSGSSDAAFDVGRSPGSSHATFAKMDRVDATSIVEAFKAGRTMVSYYGDAVLFEIDGQTSGAKFTPGSECHAMKVDAYATPGAKYLLRVVRNGETFQERTFTVPADGRFSFETPLVEEKDAWYVATLRLVRGDGKTEIRSAASPIYFRGPSFRAPEVVPFPRPLPANIKERLLYLTPDEVDTDAWYDELKQLLKEAAK